ncbi:FMN-linked oxidoreductase [Polyporus arcularius HHB13444]|uniref:Dihydroorotate oxidase n=1 Tax=Polyporus arcularius HHB13444 TaxID=1314778 RepID=A0A5C3NRK4_9APHY|nr:FMN-linked oxidoreductase [Polyporus arcularius HHB13444]
MTAGLALSSTRGLCTISRRAVSTGSQQTGRSSAKTGAYASLLAVTTGLFAIYYFDCRAAIHKYVVIPVIRHTLDPEAGRKLALWGETLSNPVGLAAGFDKHGEATDDVFNLGFSWVEIGSITPKPQVPGESKPRVFHLPDGSALINRYGFPSEGHAAVLARLRARLPMLFPYSSSPESDSPLCSAKSTRRCARMHYRSEPGKNKSSLPDSIADFVAGLLLKIAPELIELEVADVAAAVRATNDIEGVIISNTTIQHLPSLSDPNKVEQGGLSGPPLKRYSLATLRTLRGLLPASIPIIGCGGISSGVDALEFAHAGAAADELAALLRKEGKTWQEVMREYVQKTSLREGQTAGIEGAAAGAVSEASVKLLMQEAEKLERLLDGLGERIKKRLATPPPPVS